MAAGLIAPGGVTLQGIASDLGATIGAIARALLDEAIVLFVEGAPDTARLILRDLVNATVGFEALAREIHKPPKSLHRMLSPKGNPSMDKLAAFFRAVRERLQVNLSAHSVAA